MAHLQEHAGAVDAVAASPSRRTVVSASRDGTARVWDCGALEEQRVQGSCGALLGGEWGGLTSATFVGEERVVVGSR